MLVLIAESKTMTACSESVSESVYSAHRPLLETDACKIMEYIGSMSADELAEALKISGAMARRMKEMIYEFPNKGMGARAAEAFTGVVFRAFDYGSLNDEERLRCHESVRIISSLYGWLRPDDIVKRYRLEYSGRIAPGDETLAAYLRSGVTECLSDYLGSKGCNEVLNLLPADAMRCIDRKRIDRADMLTAVFSEMQPGGTFKTPDSNRLKTLRGRLLRKIITENISDMESLAGIHDSTFVAEGYNRERGEIRFVSVAGSDGFS